MKYMVIDIGSNTVKYDIFDVDEKGYFLFSHRTYPARLIGKIENGMLLAEAEKLLIDLLKKFKTDADEKQCDGVFAFATAGLRKLRDPAPLLAHIERECHLNVRVLTGEEEGQNSFKGMLLTLSDIPPCGMMMDMGGGSTEINIFEGTRSLYLRSCPFGAGVIKNAFSIGDRVSAEQKAAISGFVDRLLPSDLPDTGIYGKTAVLVGGTGKTAVRLAKALCGSKMKGAELALNDFLEITAVLSDPTPEQYARAKEIAPDRYKLMASGLCAYTHIFERMGTEKLYIAPGGVREGYLATILGKDMHFYL